MKRKMLREDIKKKFKESTKKELNLLKLENLKKSRRLWRKNNEKKSRIRMKYWL